MTKEIVQKAFSLGKYTITSNLVEKTGDFSILRQKGWEYSLSYANDQIDLFTAEETIVSHNMEKLQDLKSRALLIVNTERKQQNRDDDNVDFQTFIKAN